MSRKVAITVTVELRLPIPPGHKPKDVVDDLKQAILAGPAFKGFENQVTLRVTKRETTYI